MNTLPCTLYLVRHGQTESNRAHRNTGHSDSPLTEQGIQEAQDLREELADIPFAAVYTSDLARTVATAQIILQGREMPITQLPALRERSFGALEAQPEALWKQLREDQAERYNALSTEEKWRYSFAPDLENDSSLFTRVQKALKEIAGAHPGKSVLIVTSAGPVRLSLIGLGFYTLENLPPGSFKNGAFAKLIVQDGSFKLAGIFGRGVDATHLVSE